MMIMEGDQMWRGVWNLINTDDHTGNMAALGTLAMPKAEATTYSVTRLNAGPAPTPEGCNSIRHSGLGPGSQDVVEQNVAEGEFSWIVD
jgi:hypothetical protein